MMDKLMRQNVSELVKEIDALKSTIKNGKVVFENELQLFRKTFSIQELEIQRNFTYVIS